MHQEVARVAVVGLGDFDHEEHFRPRIDVEIVLVILGGIIRQGGERLVEVSLDIRLIHALLRSVIADVLDVDAVVLQEHVMHTRDLELIRLLRDVVVVQHEAAVGRVVVLLRREQIVAEILAVHPHVHKARLQTDAHLIGQIHGDLVAQQGVVEIIRQQRPFLGLHAGDELGLVLLVEVGLLVERDVVGLFRKVPGGVSAALDADELADVAAQRLAVAARLVVLVAVHGGDRAEALVELEEHGIDLS